MPTLPPLILSTLQPFSTIFVTNKTCMKAFLLLLGVIVCKGGRTVCAVLRVLGLRGERAFSKYHNVLNRATVNLRQASKILLSRLDDDKSDPLVIAVDAHLERRRGKRIAAKGCYRDPVRSSRNYTVKCHGLRWLSMVVVKRFSWFQRPLALPFFTLLAPSEKANEQAGKRHKTLIDWTIQMIMQLRRWMPRRAIILTADGEFATAALAWSCVKQKVSLVTRLRLDARLFGFPVRRVGPGRPAKKGERLVVPKKMLDMPDLSWESTSVLWYGGIQRCVQYLSTSCLWHVKGYDPVPIRFVMMTDPEEKWRPVLLMSTDVHLEPSQIIESYVSRWSIEVTFREAREHLGVETQRQWSKLAILRSTPILFGLYSLVVIIAGRIKTFEVIQICQAAWYQKE